MAAVAVVLICITIPLVMLQRRLMRTANRFVTMKGKASRGAGAAAGQMALGRRSGGGGTADGDHRRTAARRGAARFISNWGVGVSLWDELSLATFHNIWQQPNLLRAIVNSMAIGIIGGALAVICYLFVGIAMHRKADNVTRFLDYSVLVPRAVPGLLAGLGLPVGIPVCADVARSVAEARLALGAAGGRLAAGAPYRAAARPAQHHLQRLAGLHRGVDGLRPAAHLLDAAAGGPGAGGGGA